MSKKPSMAELVSQLAWTNVLLWHEEDKARVSDDHQVAAAKRNIDKLNQQRNDLIEAIDESVIALSPGAIVAETAGSLIDKITIIEHRVYHLHEQLKRSDVEEPHREHCRRKLAVLDVQKADLLEELNELLTKVLNGKQKLKIYRQFKLYNDPRYRVAQDASKKTS